MIALRKCAAAVWAVTVAPCLAFICGDLRTFVHGCALMAYVGGSLAMWDAAPADMATIDRFVSAVAWPAVITARFVHHALPSARHVRPGRRTWGASHA